jgi:hypothetical protein
MRDETLQLWQRRGHFIVQWRCPMLHDIQLDELSNNQNLLKVHIDYLFFCVTP